MNMEKYKVGIIGGTGMVGQRFVTLMENHPWFQLTAIAASPRSAGQRYEDAVSSRWAMATPIPQEAKDLIVREAYDPQYGFTVGTQTGAIFKRAVIKRAKKVVMMLDSSKSCGLLPFTFATPEDVNVLVTDGKLEPEISAELEQRIALVL